MSDQFCARCGKYLTEGSLKYIVHIQILSDFDGVIPYTEDDLSEEIQMLLQTMEDKDAQELENEVYQELSFILCSDCKKRFTRDPLNSEQGVLPMHKKMENTIH